MIRWAKAFAALFAAMIAAAPLTAQRAPAPAAQPSAPAPLDDATINTWLKSRVLAPLGNRDAGAAMAVVVQDGEVKLARQFGYRDAIRRVPIGPNDQFIIASVTKTFTGLAILKLIEEGKLSGLDAPANRYLRRWKIPAPWGDRVSIGQLASHSAGFESPGFGSATGGQRDIPASSEFLTGIMPTVVRAPGSDVTYANNGIVALGILIEDVSGMTFADYVRTRLLEPLGMRNTVVNYDPTGGPALIRPVIWEDGKASYPPRVINDPYNGPAGSIQTTANDMAKYLNALLGHRPDVLSPALLARQRTPLASNDPRIEESAVALFRNVYNGVPVYSHGGLFVGFRTNLAYAPEKDLGVFVAFSGGADAFNAKNSAPGQITNALIWEATGKPQQLPPLATPVTDLKPLVGEYQMSLRAWSTPEALYALNRISTVAIGADGKLTINGDRYVEVAPGLFQGPPRENRPPNLVSITPDRIEAGKFVSYRMKGLARPSVRQNLGLVLLFLSLTGVVALFGRGSSKWPAVAIAAASAVVTAVLVWPIYAEYDFDYELFAGSTWRWWTGTAVAWAWVVAAVAGTVLIVRDLRMRAAGTVAIGHRLLVVLAAIGLAAIAASLNYL